MMLLTAALGAALGAPAAAQVMPCPEFPINEYTTGGQTAPRVAAAPSGDFVVVWSGPLPENAGTDIFGRRYDASGRPRGPEFQVNTYTTGDQKAPAVAVDAGGNFVVVWDGQGDGDATGIFAQRYDASGTRQGGEFLVNTTVLDEQMRAEVAAQPAGAFVVVWDRFHYPGPRGIFGQRYDAGGVRQGPEFQPTVTDDGTRMSAAVSAGPEGGFVVVWHRNFFGGSFGVFGRRYGPDGVALASEFQIDTGPADSGLYPSIAHGPNGDFVVVWELDPEREVVGRRFDAAGVAQGAPFAISDGGRTASMPVIVGGPQDYLVLWGAPAFSTEADVYGHRLGPSGVPFGSEFRINSYTTSRQVLPSLTRTPHGGFVAVWRSTGQDGDGYGIMGSRECARLYTVSPCRLADTRDPPGTPLAANDTRTFPVTGSCGIPADARAVAVNATAVNPTDSGDLRLYPAGAAAPLASALNFTAGHTRANNAIVPLGTGGQVAVQCDMPPGSAGATHLVLDVFGYFKR